MKLRRIARIFKSQPTIEGAGVHLKRAFGHGQIPLFDPFLMLDDFHSREPSDYLPGFPWHPHRGIETITYLIDGRVEHGDSLGNRGVINSGEVQWMTAGSGIIHQEMPQLTTEGIRGFQFWANLPAAQKMMNPRYRGLLASDIPEVVRADGTRIRIVSGACDGTIGPVRDIVINPEFFDITLPPNRRFSHRLGDGITAFAYVIDGSGTFDPNRDPFALQVSNPSWSDLAPSCLCRPETAILYEHDGDTIEFAAAEEGLRVILVSGRPLGEPIAWYGPIVMNTEEELRTAFAEYAAGTFIKGGKSA